MDGSLELIAPARSASPQWPLRRFEGQYAFSVQCILGVALTLALAGLGLTLKLNQSTASLLYLLLIVAFAVRCGFWQATVISISAFLCQAYFFTAPLDSFLVPNARNGMAFVIFEATALVVSCVSASERAYAIEGAMHRKKVQQLYAISQGALVLSPHAPPERPLANLILKEFHLEAVAIANTAMDSIGTAGCWVTQEDALWDMVQTGNLKAADSFPAMIQRPLRGGSGQLGHLLVLGKITPMALDSLASLVALTLERHRAMMNESAAETARQTEQLRTTVLDGLAHAFKTPLTIIRAASSGLLEEGGLDEMQHQLIQMVDEQSDRLLDMTNQVLQTAKAEGGDLCLQLERIHVPTFIREVIQDFRSEYPDRTDTQQPAIYVSTQGQTRPLVVDHDMLASTVKELLINAVKYSTVGSPITVTACEGTQELLLSVHNRGPAIRVEDREHIFEKFYRGAEHHHAAPGTGLGLFVARRVAEVHGGRIWVTSGEMEGTTFHLSLPRQSPAREMSERLA